jgi:hypothetical protein
MRDILEALNLQYADDCVVTVTSETTDTDAADDNDAADEADGEQVDPDDYGTDASASASAMTGSTSSGPAPPSSSSSLWITAILSYPLFARTLAAGSE